MNFLRRTFFLKVRFIALLLFMLALLFICQNEMNATPHVVTFKDRNLEAAVRELLRNPFSTLTQNDVAQIEVLRVRGDNISSIEGLEFLVNLERLDLRENRIEDISPIANLTNLQELDLRDNRIVDINALGGLSQLRSLNLRGNRIKDIAPVVNITALQELNARDNQIESVEGLEALYNLRDINLRNNNIHDVTPISQLTNLDKRLYLEGNPINDFTSLSLIFDDLEEKDFELRKIVIRDRWMDTLIVLIISTLLMVMISEFYMKTHQNIEYSASFIHTMIMMGITIAIIMIVIGQNLAVAIGLVGAFSIIRFRNAMGDPKDIAFIFLAMGTGMAVGLGFYSLSVVFTLIMGLIIIITQRMKFLGDRREVKTLKLIGSNKIDTVTVIQGIENKYFDYCSFVRMETTNLGTDLLMEYKVVIKPGVIDANIIRDIQTKSEGISVSLKISTV